MPYSTEQENFWANEFGDDYIERNKSAELLASNIAFFARALRATDSFSNLIELGANVGMNISALTSIFPNAQLAAVEINSKAAAELGSRHPSVEVFNQSIIDFSPDRTWDVVLLKGVLIHINPDMLPSVYSKIADIASKYVLIAEYYNPTPVALNYRGHADRLFKRDFAGEFLDAHDDFRLVDYGFAYHRDTAFPQDDITWFLLERRGI